MPKLISQINFGIPSVGIASDGSSLGTVEQINFRSNTITISSGIATVTSDPLTILGL
jgi:hypothetical protein